MHGYAYDGNGNVMKLIQLSTGTVSAEYGYGPFGEPLRATGAMAKANPFRWSTKYCDEETGLCYYGYRYYQPQMGRWLSRDLLGDQAFFARLTEKKTLAERLRLRRESRRPLYLLIGNSPIESLDWLGLAYFAYRPLEGPLGWFGVTGESSKLDDKTNTVNGHEQLFFEDGNTPSDTGFSENSTLESDPSGKYDPAHDKGYNDCVMRKAVGEVKLKPFCTFGKPGATEKNNCQDWADEVRAAYRKLIRDPAIREQCCPIVPGQEKK